MEAAEARGKSGDIKQPVGSLPQAENDDSYATHKTAFNKTCRTGYKIVMRFFFFFFFFWCVCVCVGGGGAVGCVCV